MPRRPKPTVAQLGIDLAALRWQRSGRGAGSFEVALVGVTDGLSPAAEAVAAGSVGLVVTSSVGPVAVGSVGLAASRVTSQVGYPAGADAQWVLLRVAGDPAARVLIYDRIEWASFVDGAAKGEFDAAASSAWPMALSAAPGPAPT